MIYSLHNFRQPLFQTFENISNRKALNRHDIRIIQCSKISFTQSIKRIKQGTYR